MQFIPNWLHTRAQMSGDHLAITDGRESWTFFELNRLTGQVAAKLRHHGISAGTRVGVCAAPQMRVVPLIHALSGIGAVTVPLNPRMLTHELNHLIGDAQLDFVIADFDWAAPVAPWLIEEIFTDIASWTAHEAQDIDLRATQFMIYTSGTTGQPKAASISYGNIYFSAIYSALHAGTQPQDLWLHTMPLFHVGGLSILFRSVLTGSGIVLVNRFDPDQIFEFFQRFPISLMSLVPTMLFRLLQHGGNFPPSLRLVLLGGAPASSALLEEALKRGVPAVRTYGLTETSSQIATRLPLDRAELFSSGHAIFPTQIAISTQGQWATKPQQPGEIFIQGPTVFQGYWNHPQLTAEAFCNGWLKTGDVGYLDQQGYLTVIDRQKDLLIRGGENISPTEIEQALTTLPGVVDAGIATVEDKEWGQLPIAVVVVDHPITHAQCEMGVGAQLSPIKRPIAYYVAPELPRTPSGKLLRKELQARFEAGHYHLLT